MTNPDAIAIDQTRALYPQIQELNNDALARLWTQTMQVMSTWTTEYFYKPDYIFMDAVLATLRQEMTRRIQAELGVVFKHDMDKFLEVINFLVDGEEPS